MNLHKEEILQNHCYTKLVYQRINKKLNFSFSKSQIETLILKVLTETDVTNFEKKGKNFYIYSKEHNIKITVNSNTFRIITVDRFVK